MPRQRLFRLIATIALIAPATLLGQGGRGGGRAADSIKYVYPSTPQLEKLKAEAATMIDGEAKLIQEMVDEVFSFGEPGFQEFETVKYLTGILEQNGFKVQRNVAGIPTGFVATWGSGKPVISLGSTSSDIPQASNKPGVGLARSAGGGRAGPRRGAQLGRAAQHRGRDRGEEDHGARPHSGHDPDLGRRRGRAHVGRKAWSRARRRASRTWTSRSSRTSAPSLGVSYGQSSSNALISGDLQVQGTGGARGRRAVARQERVRRRDADGHRRGSSSASTWNSRSARTT